MDKQIREVYSLGQLSSDSTSDLSARLRFPLTEEERKNETSTLVQRILSHYMRIALTKDSSFEVFDSRSASRQVSRRLSTRSSRAPGHPCAVRLCNTRCPWPRRNKILEPMTGPGCQKGWGTSVATVNLLQFCWLFEVLRQANAAQVVVELLLKLDVWHVLLTTFDPYATIPTRPEIVYQWASMMYVIFQDVCSTGACFSRHRSGTRSNSSGTGF